MRLGTVASFALVLLPLACIAQTKPGDPMPPRSWVDKDTGHRIWRLSDEANSGGFYFNVNAFTPDGKQMIYTAPDGIHVMEIDTRATRLLVPNATRTEGVTGTTPGMVHALVVGHKTNSVVFTKTDAAGVTGVYKADTNTGAIKKLVDLPAKRNIVSINADETLAAGTYIVGDATGKEYGSNVPAPAQPAGAADNKVASAVQGPHYQPTNKGAMMEARLAARLPLVLFKPATCSGPAMSSE
jgi:oligogalacturonide lyase